MTGPVVHAVHFFSNFEITFGSWGEVINYTLNKGLNMPHQNITGAECLKVYNTVECKTYGFGVKYTNAISRINTSTVNTTE